MSIELLLYLIGASAILAYSAYIDTDDPLMFLFFAFVWPVALAIFVPVVCGLVLRRILKGADK